LSRTVVPPQYKPGTLFFSLLSSATQISGLRPGSF
jgi:hypothetical protein